MPREYLWPGGTASLALEKWVHFVQDTEGRDPKDFVSPEGIRVAPALALLSRLP